MGERGHRGTKSGGGGGAGGTGLPFRRGEGGNEKADEGCAKLNASPKKACPERERTWPYRGMNTLQRLEESPIDYMVSMPRAGEKKKNTASLKKSGRLGVDTSS